MDKTALRAWAAANPAPSNLIYAAGLRAQMGVVLERVAPLFLSAPPALDEQVSVIAAHKSKSVVLPVMEVAAPGIRLTLRDNHFNWKVSVESARPLQLDPAGLFESHWTIRSGCEGFPDDRVFGSYASNPAQFTVEVGCDRHLLEIVKQIAAQRK